MNRAERSILSPVLKRLREIHSYAWWELKRQIWDGGFQTYYPMQGEFELPARRALECLAPEHKAILRDQWQQRYPGEETSDQAVDDHYFHVLIEELVKRANQAAYRTSNW